MSKVASAGVVHPASFGAQIPKDSFELMRQLRLMEKNDNSKIQAQQKINRTKKQELAREALEVIFNNLNYIAVICPVPCSAVCSKRKIILILLKGKGGCKLMKIGSKCIFPRNLKST